LKTVIIGGSKILIAFVTVIALLVVAVLAWFTYGIRPFDRLNAKVIALGNTDPDQALTLYPQIFTALDTEHMCTEDRGMVYSEYGRFLKEHGRTEQAIESFNKAIECSAKGWKGITKCCSMLDIAECRLGLEATKKLTQADIDSLLQAGALHPTRESGEDKWFWPAYDQALGRMYCSTGDYPKALVNLQKALDEYKAYDSSAYSVGARGLIVEALVRQGKYVQANEKFIEFCSELKEQGNGYQLRECFRNSLARAQDKDPGFTKRVLAMLSHKQFADMDLLAAEMLASKKIWPSGRRYINNFFAVIDSLEATGFDADWQVRIDLLKQWIATRPDSTTAKIALARLLESYAWKARGRGWSDSVTAVGWKKFAERLAEAKAILDQIKDKPAEWYPVTQRCALGQGWEAGPYDAMVEECRKRYPDYDLTVFSKCYWLQPRWHGEPGQFESYLASEANKRPGKAGDMLYARSAWYLDAYGIDNIMNEGKLSWPRVKSGMHQVVNQSPESLLAKGVLSVLAMEAGDKTTAQKAFDTTKQK
jgi:tetratricopeptide (TPR) repeat protein